PMPLRVLLTKPTHDCHDRGVRHLARKLRDAGFEVVFTNFLLAQEVVDAAVQEDVDVIGVSSSSGGHMAVFEDLLKGLRQADADDIVVIAGGVIPDEDARTLKQWGIREVFGPGRAPDEILAFLNAQAMAP
ncbi:MAG: cobalamin-dependent protein, partial [Steroidobacteraceae bacterium]